MAAPLPSIDPGAFLREHVAPRSARRIAALRSDITRLERELDERLGAEATIQLLLEGDGGGVWYLNVRHGETRVEQLPEEPPVVRVYQTRSDWEALARLQLAEATDGPPGVTELTRSRVDRLRGLDGALEFRLTTPTAEHGLTIQFGVAERAAPRCTIAVPLEDARRLQRGEITPQAAFMQGMVKLQGDLAFAMQVGAALLF